MIAFVPEAAKLGESSFRKRGDAMANASGEIPRRCHANGLPSPCQWCGQFRCTVDVRPTGQQFFALASVLQPRASPLEPRVGDHRRNRSTR